MKLNFSSLLNHSGFVKALSILLAVISWLVVINFIDTDATLSVRGGVTVDITEHEAADLAPMNLSIVDGREAKVDVTVEGERYIISTLTADDIALEANLAGITDPGTYPVSITGKKVDGFSAGDKNGKGFTIKSISPTSAQIRVDRLAKKKFTLTTDIKGLQISEPYLGSETLLNPKEVTIVGPETDVAKIDRCVVAAEFNEPLTSSRTIESEIILYDAQGEELPRGLLSLDAEKATITVPVLKQKRFNLNFDFTNVPVGFPIDRMEYRLSDTAVDVAGQETVVDAYGDTLNLGFIPLSSVTKNAVFPFEVELPTGCVLLDDSKKNILVAFDTPAMQSLEDATLTIPKANIIPTNLPINYEVTVVSANIANVRVTGDPDVLATLSGSDLVAEIDISGRGDITTGSYSLPVSISAPGKGFVWATGSYTAVVTIAEK